MKLREKSYENLQFSYGVYARTREFADVSKAI